MLVRIAKLPAGNGNGKTDYENPPDYASGAYLTSFINVSPEELAHMARRVKEPSKTVREVIDSWHAKEDADKTFVGTLDYDRLTSRGLTG